jgi:uncharacterized protein
MYINRELKDKFLSCIKQFPAVLITGPRQSGKSTFLHNEMKDAFYVTFDDPLNRNFAIEDPNGFLDQFEKKPVIIDEIQYVPEILQYIKIRIDKDRKSGIWIMTGSQQFNLMKNINETLAGRIAILELCPFSLTEAGASEKKIEDIVWQGLYPEISCFPEKRDLWVKSYIQTYIERDIRQFQAINDFRSFEMFINLCAAFHAQEFHSANLARDCGVSQPTIKSWSKILEACFISINLPPFFKNYGKRIIKTSKLYFIDSAIVCYLTRQPSADAAVRGNMGGAFFEGLIISEVWKIFLNLGKRPDIFFWRSHSGLEIDLIICVKGKFLPVEIKLTATPMPRHAKALNKFKEIAKNDAAEIGAIVCNVNQKTKLPGNNLAIPWQNFSDWLKKSMS